MLHEMATESARSLVVVQGREGGLKKGTLAGRGIHERREPVSCDGGVLIENLLEEMTLHRAILARLSVITYWDGQLKNV